MPRVVVALCDSFAFRSQYWERGATTELHEGEEVPEHFELVRTRKSHESDEIEDSTEVFSKAKAPEKKPAQARKG